MKVSRAKMDEKELKLSNGDFSINVYARELAERRVAIWDEVSGNWRPIAVALSPTIVPRNSWLALETDARKILNCFPKAMNWILRSAEVRPETEVFLKTMLSDLSPLEASLARITPAVHWGHPTVRLDLFWHLGEIKVIEVNCTIPAMQAYSDNVLSAWGVAGGRSEAQPSNVDQLLKSLLFAYRSDGGTSARPRIATLHRFGDSQLGELQWIKRRWSELGIEAVLATPEHLKKVGDLWMVGETPCELIYRHIFASKLQNEDVLTGLRNSRRFHIYNPVSAHYECKAFFAILSHIAADPDLWGEVGLTKEEAYAIERRLPWSRVIGGPLASVPAENVERRLEGLVLKRSVGYGGHHVLMGDSWFSEDNQARLERLTGMRSPVSFKSFATWMEQDSSLWVVQERMSGAKRETDVLTTRGVERWNAWFDASLFINTAGPPICSGGVSRIAQSPIVNIGTGGGLSPFLIDG